jgi:excisionase family DNA binding protein
MSDSTKLLLDVREAARRVGIGRSKFYQELLSGRCESVTIGRRRLVPVVSLDAYIARLLADQSND